MAIQTTAQKKAIAAKSRSLRSYDAADLPLPLPEEIAEGAAWKARQVCDCEEARLNYTQAFNALYALPQKPCTLRCWHCGTVKYGRAANDPCGHCGAITARSWETERGVSEWKETGE